MARKERDSRLPMAFNPQTCPQLAATIYICRTPSFRVGHLSKTHVDELVGPVTIAKDSGTSRRCGRCGSGEWACEGELSLNAIQDRMLALVRLGSGEWRSKIRHSEILNQRGTRDTNQNNVCHEVWI